MALLDTSYRPARVFYHPSRQKPSSLVPYAPSTPTQARVSGASVGGGPGAHVGVETKGPGPGYLYFAAGAVVGGVLFWQGSIGLGSLALAAGLIGGAYAEGA